MKCSSAATKPHSSALYALYLDSESLNCLEKYPIGLVAALEHFMTYLKNAKVTAFTDHMPLAKAATRDKNTESGLLYKLSTMELSLLHIKGTDMPADALSRQNKIAQQAIKGNLAVAASSIMETIPAWKVC